MIFLRYLLAISLLLLGLACAATQAERETKARDLTTKAQALYTEGLTRDALKTAMEALEEDPAQLQARLIAADCLLDLMQPEQAFTILLDSGPEDRSPSYERECLLHASVIARRMEQPSMAVVYLNRALALAPEDALLYQLRGEAEIACGREQAARESLNLALECGADRGEIIGRLARVLYELELYGEAQALLEERWRTGEIDAKEVVLLGMIDCQADRTAQGLERFREAAVLQPDLAEAHFNQGVALESMGDLESARKVYRTTLRIDPCYAAASFHLGRLLVDEGRRHEGLALIKAAAEQEKDPKVQRAIEEMQEKLIKEGAEVGEEGVAPVPATVDPVPEQTSEEAADSRAGG